MSVDDVRNLVRQDLALRSLHWQLHNILYFIFHHNRDKLAPKSTTPDQLVKKLRQHIDVLDPEYRDEVEELFVAEAERLTSSGEKTTQLNKRLGELQKLIENKIRDIPGSIEKTMGFCLAMIDIADFDADQEYDVLTLFPDAVPPDRIATIVSVWKKELRDSVRRQLEPISVYRIDGDSSESDDRIIEYSENVFPASKIFWTSRDFQETLDAVSRYRFLEVFNIGDFKGSMREIEHMLASHLVEGGDSDTYNLWLVQRSLLLCGKIRPFIDIALVSVIQKQEPEGWWSSGKIVWVENRNKLQPSTYRTALACFVIFQLSRDEEQISQAKRGLQWLVTEQLSDGAWAMEKPDYNSGEIDKGYIPLIPKEDLFTTLLCLQAIRASSMGGYEYTVQMAEKWIMAQQEYDGSWPKSDFPYPFLTVMILEYFQKKPLFKPLSNYLDIARSFILRAQEFALENNDNARRLAIITAFQGIEAFLYACLSHSDVNIKIFDRVNETIGMRKALTSLQSYFQSTKVLKGGQPIEYRNEMDRLVYTRDQIVHKGVEIGKKDTLEMVDASWKFANLICNRIFGAVLM